MVTRYSGWSNSSWAERHRPEPSDKGLHSDSDEDIMIVPDGIIDDVNSIGSVCENRVNGGVVEEDVAVARITFIYCLPLSWQEGVPWTMRAQSSSSS